MRSPRELGLVSARLRLLVVKKLLHNDLQIEASWAESSEPGTIRIRMYDEMCLPSGKQSKQ